MNPSTHSMLSLGRASIVFTILAMSGCFADLSDGGGAYPLAAAWPCRAAEGAPCSLSDADDCAWAHDFDVACRCAVAEDGAGIVVCDGRTPVPPSPTTCADDVVPGGGCAPDEAGRVCLGIDRARCICAPDGETDPALAGYAWSCEGAGPVACGDGVAPGVVCLDALGTSCVMDGARCRCADDPLRDGLPVWECEVPIGGGPSACVDAPRHGAICDAAFVGERCAGVDGAVCRCEASPDGTRDGARWRCDDPGPVTDPVPCPDEVGGGRPVSCRGIGARCFLASGDGYCDCIDTTDPRVPAIAEGTWECVGLPPVPGARD
ncbi:MAG: hypothetical protein AB7S26_32050 [Sandaracinaceae bacterium]